MDKNAANDSTRTKQKYYRHSMKEWTKKKEFCDFEIQIESERARENAKYRLLATKETDKHIQFKKAIGHSDGHSAHGM